MRILNFGSCNIDCVYYVDHIVKPSETIAAKQMNTYAGGKGLNQSIAMARAGAEIFHAGCIGPDGAMLRELMLSCGINLDYLKTVKENTGHAVIQVDRSGENSIVLYNGANSAVTRDYIDFVLAEFKSGDFLLLQNEISELSYLIDSAEDKGMQILLNPSPFQDELKDLDFNKISYLILNEIEAAGFSGLYEPEEFILWIKERYPELRVILTLGDKGSIYFDRNIKTFQPAFKVDAVDATAAGDTFTGYFAACIFNGKSIETALKYASAAAALAVSRKGAAPSIPAYIEVKNSLNILQPKIFDGFQQMKNAVRLYFESHTDDASLSGLAVRLGYSASYTGRWLRENMHSTFSKLLLEARCRKTAEYLETTDMPVSDIIELAGYRNESFLRKAFLKEYGCTPMEYRKAKRGKIHDE